MARDCLTEKHNFHTTCRGLTVGTPSTLIPDTSTHLEVTYLGEAGSLNTFPPTTQDSSVVKAGPVYKSEHWLNLNQRALTEHSP